MGNTPLKKSKSLERFFPNFKAEDWIVAEPVENEVTVRYGQCTTLRSVVTGYEIDRYELTFFSDREQRIYQECFLQRLREEYLINAFHYEPVRTPGICSTVKGAVAYIQHVPIRLSDIDDIPFDESLYMLKCSLIGFQRLFNESGYFEVMEEHIGIDRLGRVKVWLNADFSKNYPFSFDEDSHQNKDYQRIMVNEIIHLIQGNTNYQAPNTDQVQNDPRYPRLSQFMNKNGYAQASFQQALEQINRYCLRYRVRLPKRCSSVIQIFHQYNHQQDESKPSCDEDFLDKIQVDDEVKQYQEIVERQNNQREQESNIMISSRTKNQIQHNIANAVRPFSGEEKQGEPQQMAYKQYQPTSAYKPNNMMKSSGMSASVGSVSSRKGQKIKLKSHRSSAQASRARQSNNYQREYFQGNFITNSHKNSHRSSKQQVSNQNIDVIRLPFLAENLIGGQNLYANKSQQSSNFYKQIGNDFQKICSDGSQNNSKRSSGYIQPAQQVPYIQYPQHPLETLSNSSRNIIQRPQTNSSHSSQQLQRPVNREFIQINENRLELRSSNASSQNMNNRLAGSHASNVSRQSSKKHSPKISFNYINKSELAHAQGTTGTQGAQGNQAKSQHLIENQPNHEFSPSYGNIQKQNFQKNGERNSLQDTDVDAQFRKDVQQVLSKININSNENINNAFRKKKVSIPVIISQTDQEHEIDPQIMNDIIKMQSKKQVF